MRKLLLLALTGLTMQASAQVTATFEGLSLAHADTFYVNYSASGSDVGFTNGPAHFPCVYDTSFGGFWVSGFSYSNMTDSVTSGYINQYAAKPASGSLGSAKYAVAYGTTNKVILSPMYQGLPINGFFIANSTYAYNSMRDGDTWAKKFGGTTGNDPDWFKVQIKGFRSGALTADSVDVYLADFRPAGTANDSILKTWRWVNLVPLGGVDSLQFTLSSSDTGSFGMNTPAYFCMDDLTINMLAVSKVSSIAAKVYPVPATSTLNIEALDAALSTYSICDIAGRVVAGGAISDVITQVDIAGLLTGQYVLKLQSENRQASFNFSKQ
jgi:hypothetical protein